MVNQLKPSNQDRTTQQVSEDLLECSQVSTEQNELTWIRPLSISHLYVEKRQSSYWAQLCMTHFGESLKQLAL